MITAVNTGQYTSPYLPAPYAPEAVNGLTGRWSWDPATLSIKGVDTNSRDQQYVVTSVTPQLTAALLAGASGPVRGVPEQFLREPSNVPEVVRSTAKTVTAGAASPYARAMAIQRYLRSAEFTYSLQSPVQGGYDGNGLSVLADFLNQKSGYCIHFASAMAVMARLEGIPSRIAVGYAPGRPTGATVAVSGQGPLPEFEVDARDAHAWPELYFQGVGWVAFEPTPSRGVVPAYATEAAAPSGASTNERNDALTPGDGSTQAPFPAPGTVPLPGAGNAGARRRAGGTGAVRRWRGAAAGAAGGLPAAGAQRRAAPQAEDGGPRQSRRHGRDGAAGLGGTAGPGHGLRRGARSERNAAEFLRAVARLGGFAGNPAARTGPASGPRRP